MESGNPSKFSKLIKQEAAKLGFEFTGISKAEELTEEAKRLEDWLNKGYHGKMSYMEGYFDKRIDPRKLVEGAKSVISLMFNYFPEESQEDPEAPKIARYAYGRDYHFVLKEKLKILLDYIHEIAGEVNGRCFVDSAPVMEREWAKKSGSGWYGKNTLIIHPKRGSYFFLAEIILDLELEPDGPMKNYCGTCTRCIDACPTDAISPQGYLLDASKCISYFTIELKEEIPKEMEGKFENWAFGCDICQEVCPWNRFSKAHNDPELAPLPGLLNMTKSDWEEITEEVFKVLFRFSPLKRSKFKGLKRNIKFLKKDKL